MIGVRLVVAANLLKSALLGEMNIQGNSQARTVVDQLYRLGISERVISTRSWERWLSRGSALVAPKLEKVGVMDEVHALMKMPLWLHPRGFEKLVCGGLVRSLLAPTRANNVWPVIIERAAGYGPVSHFHLHLDALEILNLRGECLGVSATDVRRLAARRIFELLYDSWSPRGGKVFRGFRSDWRRRWDAADPEQRVEMKRQCESIKPNPIRRLMDEETSPDWRRAAVPLDLAEGHVYKLLFSIPADPRFLVGERLDRWAIDSVTALLALFSHCWADRYEKWIANMSPERAYFTALEAIFLGEEPIGEIRRELLCAMQWSDAQWSATSWEKFLKGRSAYAAFLTEIGLSVADVVERLACLRDAEPLNLVATW